MIEILNVAVSAKVKVPTPFNNAVSVNISVADTEAHSLKLYKNSTDSAVKTIVPGGDISFDLKAGETLYWASDDGTSDCNVELIGNGW